MISNENNATLSKLITSLNNRLHPTVYLISCNTVSLQETLKAEVKLRSKYLHFEIDLKNKKVYSLSDAINNHVHYMLFESEPLSIIVHVLGLSSSLFITKNGKVRKTNLANELNFERERLFNQYSFVIILWESPFFFNELFFSAGDLMSWLVDKYEFWDSDPKYAETTDFNEEFEEEYNIKSSERRIKDLESLLTQLPTSGFDNKRLISDQIDTRLLLGNEYLEAGLFGRAENILMTTYELFKSNDCSQYSNVRISILLGKLYFKWSKTTKAILYLEDALSLCDEMSEDKGPIKYQIGLVYIKQKNWELALQNLIESIPLLEKWENLTVLGLAYIEVAKINCTYQNWQQALLFFNVSVELFEKLSNKEMLAKSYFELGRYFAKTTRFDSSLVYYKNAINLVRSESEFAKICFKEACRVCIELGHWIEAVSYEAAFNALSDIDKQLNFAQTYFDKAQKIENEDLIDCITDRKKLLEFCWDNYFISSKLTENSSMKKDLARIYLSMGNVKLMLGTSEVLEDVPKDEVDKSANSSSRTDPASPVPPTIKKIVKRYNIEILSEAIYLYEKSIDLLKLDKSINEVLRVLENVKTTEEKIYEEKNRVGNVFKGIVPNNSKRPLGKK